MHKPEIISELTQISKTLAENPVPAPYTLPPGYFNTLTETIMQRIRALEASTAQDETGALSPLLSSIPKQMPFALPETYFLDLPAAVIAATRGETMQDLELEPSPLLQSLRNKTTYGLPSEYFERLPQAVMQKVSALPAKVIPMSSGRKLARFAVAAAIASVVAVSGWFLAQNGSLPAAKGEMAGIKNISNKDLQDFIDQNTVVLPDNIAQASNEIKTEDVKTMLAGVPDAELQQFLELQPNLKDPALTNFN